MLTRGHIDFVAYPTSTSVNKLINPVVFPESVDGILGDEITIAETLKATGYNTGAFGKWHLGDYGQYLPNNQGFEHFYGSYYSNDMNPYAFYRNDEEVISAEDMNQENITSLLETEIDSFIDNSLDNNEKFFAYYASPWPHYPISASEDYQGTSNAGTFGDCIEEFDDSLGRILQKLKDTGVYDDTLIIFTSDNGPWQEGGNGGLRGRKNNTFEGGQKVPFLVSYPNVVPSDSNAITSPAMNIDIFPTILSYCGINQLPLDRIIDGVDISTVINGNVPRDTALHNELYYITNGNIEAVQMRMTVNGIENDYKYFDKIPTDNAAYFYQTYKNYLCNLDTDPLEAYNQSNTFPGVASEMEEKIKEMQKSFKTNCRGKK